MDIAPGGERSDVRDILHGVEATCHSIRVRSAPRCRPDWVVATGAIAFVRILRIPPQPDYEPDSTRAATSPPVHRGGAESLRVQDFAYILKPLVWNVMWTAIVRFFRRLLRRQAA